MLLASVALFAQSLSVDQARAIASEFFAQSYATKNAPSTLKLEYKGTTNSQRIPAAASQAPVYYMFNRAEGGFIVVAAERTADQILAYSFDGKLDADNMPAPMKWWLDDVLGGAIASQRAIASENIPATGGNIYKAGTPVVKYTTASWSQGAPYNGESPIIKDSKGRDHKTITGCVATAASIKARYHKWPYKGSGKAPSYTYTCTDDGENIKVTIPENQLGRVYDYDKMPLNYSGGASSEQNAQVAALMYDMGCVSRMMFGWEGSGTWTDILADGLRTYMHYSDQTKYVKKSGYSDDAWMKLLEKELAEVGPIVYSGDDGQSGHCFIFDGYTEDHYVYVNWGWGGSGNSWLKCTSSSFEYPRNMGAILNCIPDRRGIYTPAEIAAAMTMKCLKNTGKLILGLSNDAPFSVEYDMKDAEGKAVKSGSFAPGNTFELSLAALSGEYIIDINVVGSKDIVYTLTLEF